MSSLPPLITQAAPELRRQRRRNVVMKWLRRLHLYAGLLLFPWIMLYGVTAFLFNHPTAFSDRKPGTTLHLSEHPAPAALAEEVVRQLRERPGSPGIKLVNTESASYTRNLVAGAIIQGQQYSIAVDLATGQAVVRERSPRPTTANPPFAQGKISVPDAPAEQVKRQLPELLQSLGMTAEEVTIQSVPELTFEVEIEGKLWELRYNLQRGTLQARSADAVSVLGLRSFLTRLHTSHGYPDEAGPRWFWALLVDVMFVAMAFWGLSGLFMWWQLKAQRRIGIVLLLLSAVITTMLTIGMHQAMTQ